MCLFNKISFVLLVCALAVPKVLKIVPVATLLDAHYKASSRSCVSCR